MSDTKDTSDGGLREQLDTASVYLGISLAFVSMTVGGIFSGSPQTVSFAVMSFVALVPFAYFYTKPTKGVAA